MAQERMAKVGEEIKKELSKIITFDLKDPRITGIVKTIIFPKSGPFVISILLSFIFLLLKFQLKL